ncbi:MAG: outer membrane lipoprotein chaperone LolA [Bryobacteraceae bacterium]|nr:outer membrane lipoprotein chaperone LolA [Bryobacteraceae bacterium]
MARFPALLGLAALMAVPSVAADDVLKHLLQTVEARYNGAKTLLVSFQEVYNGPGGRRQTESGELYLRKPGKMRWEYKTPAGKLFLSDGKQVYFYNPATNRAEKMKLRETEDMRAPLAFLLGKLDFDKDFRSYELKNESNSAATVIAVPKSDKLPYKQVQFTVNPLKGYAIERLLITSQDNGIIGFNFGAEQMNPALSDKLFRFELPNGAQWADLTQGDGASR